MLLFCQSIAVNNYIILNLNNQNDCLISLKKMYPCIINRACFIQHIKVCCMFSRVFMYFPGGDTKNNLRWESEWTRRWQFKNTRHDFKVENILFFVLTSYSNSDYGTMWYSLRKQTSWQTNRRKSSRERLTETTIQKTPLFGRSLIKTIEDCFIIIKKKVDLDHNNDIFARVCLVLK